MALTLNDRVLETCTSPGTGAVTLLGATTGFRTFLAGVGNGNTCYYTIADQSGGNWEVGLGTYTSSSNTLARTTILSSSNSGSLVNFNSGTQNVFVTYPAEKAVYLDASGNVTLTGTLTASAINSTPIGSGTASTGAFTTLSASSTVSGTGFSNYLASPPAIGSGTPNTGAFTTLTASSDFITTLGLYSKGAFSGTYTDGIVLDYVTGTGRISVGSSDGLSIYNGGVGGTALLNLDSSGNLGLGLTPSAWSLGKNIELGYIGNSIMGRGANDIAIGTNTYYNAGYKYAAGGTAALYEQNGAHYWFTAPSGTAGSAISFTQAMTLDASGYLGIGQTSPSYPLDVAGSVRFSNGGDTYVGYGANKDNYWTTGTTSGNQIWRNSGGSEFMRLTSAGYLGIGTSSPQSLLHLDTDGTALRISRGSAIGFLYNTGTSATDITRLQSNGGSVQLYTTGGTATLDSSGNLGLGVTPSGWASANWKAFQIGTTGAFGGGISSTDVQLGSNFYNTSTGTGSCKYIASDYASMYRQISGQHQWFTAPSGTAGNAISFTQAMTLDASGNLLVGTTSTNGRINVLSGSATQSAITTNGVSGDTAYQGILVAKYDNNSTTSQNFIQFQINNGAANCGKITANGANTAAFGSTSDVRVKENIVDLPSQLSNILALRPVEFDYVESYGGGHQTGFIAQEIQEVYPDVISEDDSEEKILSITGWSKTEARLVKAIQELHAELQALKSTLH